MNILLITQVYPDEKGTKTVRSSSVCHYWTKEWVKMGHQVYVIYLYPQYYKMLHKIAEFCPNYISQFTNGTLTKRLSHSLSYELDGVHIFKIPMYKPIPKIRYSRSVINGLVHEIKAYLSQNNIKPNIIFGHFDNPVLEVGCKCKSLLNVPFVFVLHGYPSDIRRLYPNSYHELINSVDLWGFRSEAIKRDFESQFKTLDKSFIAYSGIPDYYVCQQETNKSKIEGKICYVGALIKRKYPEKILEASVPFIQDGILSLTYIGDGALSKKIKRIAKRKHINEDCLHLLGHISREQVQKELSTSEYFIMISRHETFGMVYLEAMAHGCLTIASRNEGFDGIIKDGINGFLCNAGDCMELSNLLHKIISMPNSKKEKIRMNAISTAKKMTERKMAEKYLSDVFDKIKI